MTSDAGLLRLLDTRAPDFEAQFAALEHRRLEAKEEVDRVVLQVIEDVRRRGDAAVIEAAARFDAQQLTPDRLLLGPADIEAGASALDAEARDAFATAAERVRRFHAEHVPESWSFMDGGTRLGQLVRPLARVAIYAPAAKAPLASTVLMLAMPASVAGVSELTLATPREIHPAMFEAARLSRVAAVLNVGGAQAVAALAYGTESIPRSDKIVGPGSVWVQTAKRLVFGEVAIDSEAGPSEVLIVAETGASPEYLAADLLAQAEHEELASVVLVSPDEGLLRQTLAALGRQIPGQPRIDFIRRSLADRSAAILARDLGECYDLANRYGAEHLQLYVDDRQGGLDRIENAGAIFLGPYSPVPLGDYVAGPSHVLPTGGTARFFSPIGVEDFLKRMSVLEFDRPGLRAVGPAAIQMAELEGLHAHAQAVRLRLAED
jgi:histidinol dehydrogenase